MPTPLSFLSKWVAISSNQEPKLTLPQVAFAKYLLEQQEKQQIHILIMH